MMRCLVLLALILGIAQPAAAQSARLDCWAASYAVAADRTWTETLEQDVTVLTARGIQQFNRFNWTFDPASQTVEVVDAYVTEPDGSRVQVGSGGMFTRPSAAAQNAPGFTSAQTISVVFPQLRGGSQTHVTLRIVQRRPEMLGFNVWEQPRVDLESREIRVDVTAPAGLDLHWTARGDWSATETHEGGVTHIATRIGDLAARPAETSAVSSSDFQPLFLLSSLPDWERIGAIYHDHAAPQSAVTPELAALAAGIVGDRTGRAAAEAIYDWVTSNIRYVAVYLDTNAGWVPHPAGEVVSRGYGDCKDHVALMQALLAARGIESEPALVDWGTRYRSLPLQTPFSFNHVMIYLPAFDVYANPTNPYAGFGTLDHRLEGKTVVIASAAGRVAVTPPSRPENYRYRVESRQVFAADGSAAGTVAMTMSPTIESGVRSTLANAESGEALAGQLLASTPEGGSGTIESSDPRDLEQPLTVEAEWHSPHAMLVGPEWTFLQVPSGIDFQQIGRLRQLVKDAGRPRAFPMLAGALDDQWDVTLTLPAGMVPAQLPPTVSVTNGVGRFEAKYAWADGELRVSRRLVVERDVVPPDAIGDLQRLLYAALDDSRQTLVLSHVTRHAGLGQ